MSVVRRDWIGAAANVDPLALGIIARGCINTERRDRTLGFLLLPLIRLNVVEPYFLAPAREECLFLRRDVHQCIAVAALWSGSAGPSPLPLTAGRIIRPRAGIRGSRLQPFLPLRQLLCPIRMEIGHAEEALAVGVVHVHRVAVGLGGHRYLIPVFVRFEAVLIDVQVQALGVRAGIAADPAMTVHVVEPEVVHVVAVRLGVTMYTFAEEKCPAKFRRIGHRRAPTPAAGLAPLWVFFRRAQLNPGVVAKRPNLLNVWTGFAGQVLQRRLRVRGL